DFLQMADVGGDAVIADEDIAFKARLSTDIQIENLRTDSQTADQIAEGFAGVAQLSMPGPVTAHDLGADSPQGVMTQRGDEIVCLALCCRTVGISAGAQEDTLVGGILLPIVGGCQIHEHPQSVFTTLM